MNLSQKDLRRVMEHAVQKMSSLRPGTRLRGGRVLDEGERLALCYAEAVLLVLGEHGVDTSSVVVDLSTPDSDSLE